jgi:hypothetical protein
MEAELPPFAAWRHVDARIGFEVVFFDRSGGGLTVAGHTSAVETALPFAVRYDIELDDAWRTRSARLTGRSASGEHTRHLETDGEGRWLVDGRHVPEVDGCLDVDLAASAFTNALPVRRLALRPGEAAEAPAAHVTAQDLSVTRLEQRYVRADDGTGPARYDYASPAFGFRAELVYDANGLVLDYPGFAVRSA